MKLVELQLDRLVGPTHHFGGLGVGNVASQQSAGDQSNPAAAAKQGLEKMRLISTWTNLQLIVPPQPRPDYQTLRNLGFTGTDEDLLKQARDIAPNLLSAVTSCSAMWTANAATVSAAIDSNDHRNQATQLTIANLISSIHRTTEPQQTEQDLKLALPPCCHVASPLTGGTAMRDEGAANHMRLGGSDVDAGIHIFVFGDGDPEPRHHEARQSRLACEAIARRHGLLPENVFFLKQHPKAIDAGAFHNDVVAMSHQDRLIYHEDAFFEADSTLDAIEHRFQVLFNRPLTRIAVSNQSLDLNQAVRTYLFNSQIVSVQPDAPPRIVCTRQVDENSAAHQLVKQWCTTGVFASCHFVDLNQSMSGGGGPACLRLRIPIREDLVDTIPIHSRFTEKTYDRLHEHVARHYPTELTIDDLSRIEFHQHASESQREVTRLLTTG